MPYVMSVDHTAGTIYLTHGHFLSVIWCVANLGMVPESLACSTFDGVQTPRVRATIAYTEVLAYCQRSVVEEIVVYMLAVVR